MILVTLRFDIRISLFKASGFPYDQRSHGVRRWTQKYVIAIAVTRTNSSRLQDLMLSAFALARRPVSALIDEIHLLVINALARSDLSAIASACKSGSRVSAINNLDNRYRGHVDTRSVRRACERWVARTIFRSRGGFYPLRNSCHPRVRVSARYERQRDDNTCREATPFFFSLFKLYPWTKNCLLCRTVVLDSLDNVADVHGESIGVRCVVLHDDIIFRGSL